MNLYSLKSMLKNGRNFQFWLNVSRTLKRLINPQFKENECSGQTSNKGGARLDQWVKKIDLI